MLLKGLYIIGGLAVLLLGVYTTKVKVQIFQRGQQDRFGIDIQLLILGVLMIALGMAIVGHYI